MVRAHHRPGKYFFNGPFRSFMRHTRMAHGLPNPWYLLQWMLGASRTVSYLCFKCLKIITCNVLFFRLLYAIAKITIITARIILHLISYPQFTYDLFHMHHSPSYLSREHMNPKLTCSQRQWLHSSVGRASHRYREVTGSSPVEVLNFFSGFFTQLQ